MSELTYLVTPGGAVTTVLTPSTSEKEPEPVVRRSRVGLMVVVAMAGGLACALLLVVGPLAGGREHVITAALLAGFAVGWAALAGLTGRYTDQPQHWARVPAVAMGATAAVVLVAGRSNGVMEGLGWVWPLPLLVLCAWMVVQVRRSLRSWSRRAVLYPVIGFLAVAALGGAHETVAETVQRDAMPGRLVDVGTHRRHINCTGAGSPTVVLEGGWGATSSAFDWIVPAVADRTRVCVYDRAGRGWSDSAPDRQDGDDIAADLHTLLQRAGVPGPYVLAGHSFGGLYVMSFAARYPADVAGMVLIDGTPADAFTALPDYAGFYDVTRRVAPILQTAARFGIARLMADGTQGTGRWARSWVDEFASAPSAMEDARALRTFGAKPLIVVTPTEESQPGLRAAQQRNAHLSTIGELRSVDGASHQSLVDDEADAAYVSAAIVDVVDAVR
jgi:pimeloyl-ACP methyl ester carboxylesterase